MIIYNGVVHPMDAPVIDRGYVAMEGAVITAVGPMEALAEVPEGALDAAVALKKLRTPWGRIQKLIRRWKKEHGGEKR